MKGFPTLTLKRILKQHKENTKDKELHMIIENTEVDKNEFGRLIEESTKHEPSDKKRT